MEEILLVIHLLVVLALIVIVLLQRSEGGGLGIGGGGGGAGLVSVRGTANLLTRTTAILATVFFITSIALAIIANTRTAPTSIMDGAQPATTAPVESDQPAEPGVPLSQ